MAYIDKFQRFGPDVDTEWGTWDSPFVPVDIRQQTQRGYPVPSQIHGRHAFAMQPRPLGPGANYLEGYGGSPYSLVQGYGAPTDVVDNTTKYAVIALVVIVGVLAYMWGHSNGVRKNPRRNPSRGACSNPECETCNKVRKVAKKRKPSRTRHVKACEQPRDAESGRFVSQDAIAAGEYR